MPSTKQMASNEEATRSRPARPEASRQRAKIGGELCHLVVSLVADIASPVETFVNRGC
jgi:hypothetical protein